MSSSRKSLVLSLLSTVVAIGPALHALPIQPTAEQLIKELERPREKFIPARVGWDPAANNSPDFNLTLEIYGPQATARRIHSSIRTALTPDPIAMAALLFCAFVLRWMRSRKQARPVEAITPVEAPKLILPEAA